MVEPYPKNMVQPWYFFGSATLQARCRWRRKIETPKVRGEKEHPRHFPPPAHLSALRSRLGVWTVDKRRKLCQQVRGGPLVKNASFYVFWAPLLTTNLLWWSLPLLWHKNWLHMKSLLILCLGLFTVWQLTTEASNWYTVRKMGSCLFFCAVLSVLCAREQSFCLLIHLVLTSFNLVH